jgi:hypothetical protein
LNRINLIIISKIEELKIIQDQRNKFDFHYEIVRGGIQLGKDLFIMNSNLLHTSERMINDQLILSFGHKVPNERAELLWV